MQTVLFVLTLVCTPVGLRLTQTDGTWEEDAHMRVKDHRHKQKPPPDAQHIDHPYHNCDNSNAALDLLPGVNDVRHPPQYIDLASGKIGNECSPYSFTIVHVVAFKWLHPLFGDTPLWDIVMTALTKYFRHWDETFESKGEDAETKVWEQANLFGVKMTPYMWSKKPADYVSLNDFFARKYATEYAPENNLGDALVVSPSEATATWYESVQSMPKKLKNDDWTLEGVGIPDHEQYAPNPAILLYLRPYDYHCYHSPITGWVIEHKLLNQSRYSVTVSPYIFKDVNILRRNRHAVLVVQSESHPSLKIAMLMIGAATIDSIRNDPAIKKNSKVSKGQHIGCFAHGGSSTALFFNQPVNASSFMMAYAINRGMNFKVKAGTSLVQPFE
eukprot:gnl/TRDRNA2_/TRDRNA2_90885_c0_seq1.p1 gnl/TRDRNA2_/TRDRNA2_90885_c0~~gnl/TRDRNA2_/TRDRNA2_90885_c0_seq1.p1  ORF type:complete len:386 (-),score=18.70 gnl/TRDRNA2_/TRDRNA2_90885_c0_seq1:342-1499(-)